jgi:glutamate/tyrosine decarboxylase-like PLP-dependent enzyme
MKNPSDFQQGLLPDFEAREKLWIYVIQQLNEAVEHLPEQSPSPTLGMSDIRGRLEAYDFRGAQKTEAVVDEVLDLLIQGMVHTQHPGYFGLFNPSPTFPGIVADTITAALNPQLAVWSHAPAAVEMERHVIREICHWIGLESERADGHFTSGGAEANYTAALIALTSVIPQYAERGAVGLTGQPCIYASEESHLAWYKIAHQAGIGRAAVRLVPTDGSGRMNASELEAMIERDNASGCIPVMVAATAGTTNAGMIDPLPATGRIARERGLWFHVDAAWGGAVCVSSSGKKLMSGIETADSATIDAHKWFSVPMGAGMILCRDRSHFHSTFRVDASYMPKGLEGLTPYSQTIQWSRRFIGLKLFLSLAVLGKAGYAVMIQRCRDLAARLADLLEKNGWEVVNDPALAVVCFVDRDRGVDVESIARRIVEGGKAWISVAIFEKGPVLRACITSHRTREPDLVKLVHALNAARELEQSIDPDLS